MTNSSPLPSFWTQDHAHKLQVLAQKAGASLMSNRDHASSRSTLKEDGSPVSHADREAQEIIIEGLLSLTPNIPIVAEEKENPQDLSSSGTYWLVDPLDGTRNYLVGGKEFAVCLGLIVHHEPCLGLIYAPAMDLLYYGDPYGVLSLNSGRLASLPKPIRRFDLPRLIVSRTDAKRMPLSEWQQKKYVLSWQPCSSAIKFGLLASDEADLYPRVGRTYEWDIAAGDAILRALGGGILSQDGKTLTYGKPQFLNNGFLAYSSSFNQAQVQDFLKRLNLP